jgi:hypothetical protein
MKVGNYLVFCEKISPSFRIASDTETKITNNN